MEDLGIVSPRQHSAWLARSVPMVEEVCAGLWSLPIPMGSNPMRFSYCYAFLDGPRVLLVDPGWPDEASWVALMQGLQRAEVAPESVVGVLVTHAHHDHYGLAPRVSSVSSAWVALGRADWPDLVAIDDDYGEVLDRRRRWLRVEGGASAVDAVEHGGDTSAIQFSAASGGPDRGLEHGDVIRFGRFEIEAVATPGHSPGHTVFWERTERLLLSGDHVLPRVSPNISTFVGHSGTALIDYLDSLTLVRDLDVSQVLPGHEYRFTDLRRRVDELAAHHEARLAEILDAVDSRTVSAWGLSAELRWSRPWERLSSFARRAATGETLAHLRLLERRNLIELEDTDGSWTWRRARHDDRSGAASR
jgi:glyoxylase-like metal-dependent hydrolase (beta-lactamase superfamily II)